MSEQLCRWGIMSTAGIALKNWHSIAASGNGQVVAVASRSVEKAQAFIDNCQASVPVDHQVDALVIEGDLAPTGEKCLRQLTNFMPTRKQRLAIGIGGAHAFAPMMVLPKRLVALQTANVLRLGQPH